jgi:hypothetical protein
MADWLVATLRGDLGRCDNPVDVSLTLHQNISSSDPVRLRWGARGNGRAWIGTGSHSFPCPAIWNPPRNGNTALTIFSMVIILLLFSTSESVPWPTF